MSRGDDNAAQGYVLPFGGQLSGGVSVLALHIVDQGARSALAFDSARRLARDVRTIDL